MLRFHISDSLIPKDAMGMHEWCPQLRPICTTVLEEYPAFPRYDDVGIFLLA
jgi:hypothetical protein